MSDAVALNKRNFLKPAEKFVLSDYRKRNLPIGANVTLSYEFNNE